MKSPVRVLHLEDNPDDAELIKELLLRDKLDVEITRVDRREAYEAALQDDRFELILCDYGLPSFDGLSALRLAQQRHFHIPFIFVSGAIGEELAVESLKEGATDYILKDRLSRLPSAVRRVIREVEESERQRQFEERFLHTQKMETVGTLAGGIAHNFNNILGVILGYVTLMKKGEMEPATVELALDAMIKAVDRGATLVRQLMTFARKSEVHFMPVSSNALVEEVAKICSETFPKQIKIMQRLAQNPPSIVADNNQVHQALLNLCINARDAMPHGGTILLWTEVVYRADLRKTLPEATNNKYVCIGVKDTGTGIDKSTLSRIFEPFFTTKDVGKGTGLGLAMVYGMINSHRGLISVHSEMGRGTMFRLYFPVADFSGTAVNFEERPDENINGGSETILVVEDEETILELARRLLEAKGYRVLIARDGIGAIGLFKAHAREIELVVLDLGLPKLGGWEAFQKMKQFNPAIVSIVITGYLDSRSRSDMLKNGAKNFVQKPFVPTQLLKTIRETLDSIEE